MHRNKQFVKPTVFHIIINIIANGYYARNSMNVIDSESGYRKQTKLKSLKCFRIVYDCKLNGELSACNTEIILNSL